MTIKFFSLTVSPSLLIKSEENFAVESWCTSKVIFSRHGTLHHSFLDLLKALCDRYQSHELFSIFKSVLAIVDSIHILSCSSLYLSQHALLCRSQLNLGLLRSLHFFDSLWRPLLLLLLLLLLPGRLLSSLWLCWLLLLWSSLFLRLLFGTALNLSDFTLKNFDSLNKSDCVLVLGTK